MVSKARVGKKSRNRKTRSKRISTRAKQPKDQAKAAVKEEEEEEEVAVEVMKSVCSTPEGMEYRIPKPETCPPAPSKRRLEVSVEGWRAEGLFNHRDVEVFFTFTENGAST
ncbi:hypothetical protein MLD38_004198 [Melastoma candidum]|uniref:Uncharacterized protein n=1 Tax=Melastoma candidum TaxID=119954 RepID=A0ACB9S6A7_9MYRT|nr:hypothetical protein MLD38_004198 [Melastoma candidum]